VNTLLHLDQISGRYGHVTALHPFTLTVEAGTRHALIGPNGAGKSTLLHLIAGTLRPAAGRVVLDGHDITRRRPADRARAGITRTFQHPGIIAALTVAEHLRLAQHRHTGKDQERLTAVASVLHRVGLAELANVPAGQLTYGQQRLLELATALATRPRLLLLDEPSAGLDTASINHLADVLHDLPGGTGVMLVDHHLPLVWKVADTVTVLHHGTHLITGTPAQVREDQTVQAAYLHPAGLADDRPAHTGGPIVLQVRGLRAGYQGADVLHDIDLDIRGGTVHALLGLNGAGKSTLLNTIGGLHRARAGTVTVTAAGNTADRTPAARSAIVPQGRRLFAGLTVGEHLDLAARRHGSGRPAWTRAGVLKLMPTLGDALHRTPGQLSGGQQQFLALARALLLGPDLLLLDEPTEGLAPALTGELRHVLAQLRAAGQTVLIAEQNTTFAFGIADTFTVLDHGRAVHTAAATDPGALDHVNTRLGALSGDLT
jgi:ABC-type branched-subunit amino acid transport system ATPase component